MRRTKNNSPVSPILIVTFFVAFCFTSSLYSFEGVDNSENAYSLYNERGYLKSNSYTLDGNFVINDFNGNLIYSKRLRRIPTTQNGITQDLKLVYNGSVAHIVSSGLGFPSSYRIQSTVNSPEWIFSLNGYALQVLNFENELITWVSDTASDDETSYESDVALLVNGYHYCFSRAEDADPQFTVLLEDGSVRNFTKSLGWENPGTYLTLDKDDPSKAHYYFESGEGWRFKVFNPDGTTITFVEYFPDWKTMTYDDQNAIMLLPVRFSDRFGNDIVVEYYYKYTDSSAIYGRPLLKRVGDFYFDWGDLLTPNGTETEVKIFTLQEDTIYTISFGDLENNNPASMSLEFNRALVTEIEDAIGRTESFGYLGYIRNGVDRIQAPYQPSPANKYAAQHFWFSPRRLYIHFGYAGGITRFKYINDNLSWSTWPSWNTTSGLSNDSIEVDFEWSRVCDTSTVPCYQSDSFPDYGRDPYFTNMVVGKVRFSSDTTLVSHDSMNYYCNPSSDYFAENVSYITLKFQDSTFVSNGQDGGKKDSLNYKQYKEWPGFFWLQKDRDWAIKQVGATTFDWRWVIDEYTWAEVEKNINYWRIVTGIGRLLLDSVETVRDSKSQIKRFDYKYVNDTTLPSTYDTLVNIVEKSSNDDFGLWTTSYYNDSYLAVNDAGAFYTNNLVDSQVISFDTLTLSKSINEFYESGSDSGYIGQLSKESRIDYQNGQSIDTVSQHFIYLKDAIRPSDNGALKRLIDPIGNMQEFEYYEYGFDTLVPNLIENMSTIAFAGQAKRDTVFISDTVLVAYKLIIESSNGAGQTLSKIYRNRSGNQEEMAIINGCVDYCSDSGSFIALPGDEIWTHAQGHSTDQNVEVTSRANIYEYLFDSVFNPVTYIEYNDDGSVDTINTSFDSNGPFWYKKTSYIGIDSIVGDTIYSDTLTRYQLVDSLGLMRAAVDQDKSVLQLFFDEIHRVERIVLPYNYSSASIPDDSLYTIRRIYDDDLSDNEVNASEFVRIDSGQFQKSKIYRFDEFWRVKQVDVYDSSDTTSIKNIFDHRDRREATIDQNNFKLTLKFDNLDRSTRTTYPDSIHSENIFDTTKYATSTFSSALPNYPFDTAGLNPNLWIVESINENDHKREELFDARNQLRAIKTYTGAGSYTLYGVTYFDFDELGNLTAVQKPEGDKVQYEYNSFGWLLKEWSADYDSIYYQYNKKGNLVRKKDGNLASLDSGTVSNWQYMKYDELSRIIESGYLQLDDTDTLSILPERVYCYDQSSSSNSQGQLSFVYSTFRDLPSDYKYAEKYDYDARGRLIHQANTFDDIIDSTLFDSLNVELLYETGSDTAEISLPRNGWVPYKLARTVSGSGNYAKILKNGSLVASNESPNPSTIEDSVQSTAGDTITLIVNSNSTGGEIKGWAWYVNHSKYQKFVTGSNGRTFHIWYEYNDADQLVSITYPDSSKVTYTYDDRARLDGVGDGVDDQKYANFSYTQRDEIEQMILGDNLQLIDYDYNARGWLNSINDGVASGGDKFGQQLYYYDDSLSPPEVYYNGNVLSQKIVIETDSTRKRYEYDELDRLTKVSRNFGEDWYNEEYFEYDKNGNRSRYALDTLFSSDTLYYQYIAGSNVIDSIFGGSSQTIKYQFDVNGNLSYNQLKGQTFNYDLYNRLLTIIFNHSSIPDDTLRFQYNAAGERIYKRYKHYWTAACPPPPPPPPLELSGGGLSLEGSEESFGPGGGSQQSAGPGGGTCTYHSTANTYYIRGKGKVLAEYTVLVQGANPLFRYIYAGDERIAMRKAGTGLHFYLNDHLGSARVVIDSVGTVKDKHKYRAFGQVYSETTNTGQKYTYTGKPFDDELELDLFYYGARYYDATLGRFTSLDPLAIKYPTTSPFVYSANNPIKYADVDGRYYIVKVYKWHYTYHRSGVIESVSTTKHYAPLFLTKTRRAINTLGGTFIPGGDAMLSDKLGENISGVKPATSTLTYFMQFSKNKWIRLGGKFLSIFSYLTSLWSGFSEELDPDWLVDKYNELYANEPPCNDEKCVRDRINAIIEVYGPGADGNATDDDSSVTNEDEDEDSESGKVNTFDEKWEAKWSPSNP